jgi:hypothetical protein
VSSSTSKAMALSSFDLASENDEYDESACFAVGVERYLGLSISSSGPQVAN